MSSTEGSVDLRFAMQTRRRIQGIFQVNDTVVFLLNLALQLANTPNENLDDIDNLSLKYELSVENAVKLSLAAKLLQGIVPEEMLEREDTSAPYAGTSEQTTEGGCTLRVRNLPLTTMEHDIVAVFQSFGTLREVRMQRDKTTGQFFGSAFVEYVNPSAAKLAMDQVNEKLWGSSTIHIDWANDRKNATSAAAPPAYTQAEMPTVGAMAPSNEPVSPTLFVGNLPTDLDRAGIYSLFARFDVRLLTDKMTGLPKGVAFVDYSAQESAIAARDEMNGLPYMGKLLKVTFASNPTNPNALKKETPIAPVSAIPPYPTYSYDPLYPAYTYPYGQ